MGAHGSRAQSRRDLGGSPSGRFADILQGNFTPAANGDALTGMQSQPLRFPCSWLALSSPTTAGASSQGDWDANLYVHGPSSSQLLVRSQAGAGEAPSIPSLLLSWIQLRRCLLLGLEMSAAPVLQPQLLPPWGVSELPPCVTRCKVELTLACSPCGATPKTPALPPGAKAEPCQAAERCQDQSNSPPNGRKV